MMRTPIRVATAFLAIMPLAIVAPVAVHAQSDREKVTLDATATIAVPLPTLTVEPSSDLVFGTIALPSQQIAQCQYEVDVKGRRAFADGKAAPAGTCGFLDSAQGHGVVRVRCANDQRLAFSYTAESPLAAQDVTFDVGSEQIGFSGPTADNQSTVVCASGQVNLFFGGRVSLGSKAVASSDRLTIGRIALEVFYDAGGCKCD